MITVFEFVVLFVCFAVVVARIAEWIIESVADESDGDDGMTPV